MRIVIHSPRRLTTWILFCISFLITMMVFIQQLGISNFQHEEPVLGWEPNKTRNVSDYIVTDENTSLISPPNICPSHAPPNAIVVVCSSTSNWHLRRAVRNTWGSDSYNRHNISIAFLLGLSEDKDVNDRIKYESDYYNDMIVEDFLDTYNNLTLKTILMLKWISFNCPGTSYVVKADDDAYVSVENLAKLLTLVPAKQSRNLLVGKLFCSSAPVTDPTSKWYVPQYLYPLKTYPEYVSGTAYVMSMSVAMRIYSQVFVSPIVHMEDVYVTGICASYANITPTHHSSFDFIYYSSHLFNLESPCTLVEKYLIVVSHELNVKSMYEIHDKVERCKLPENAHLSDYYRKNFGIKLEQRPWPDEGFHSLFADIKSSQFSRNCSDMRKISN